MSVLNHLAYAAAALLLLEVLVVVLVFAGVSGGLAFGLHWVNGKTDWAFGKVNGYLPMARKYVHQGTDMVGKPFIVVGAWMERIAETFGSLRRQSLSVQARRAASTQQPTRPGAVPVAPPPPTDPLT
jgi:hypothetical protein